MFCIYCGAQLPDGAIFCSKCGKRQSVPDTNPKAQNGNVQATAEVEDFGNRSGNENTTYSQQSSGSGLFGSIHQGFAKMKKNIDDNNAASESMKNVFMAYNLFDENNSDAQSQSEQALSHAVDIGMMDQLYISKIPLFGRADSNPELVSMQKKIMEKAQVPAGITYDQMRGGLKRALKSFANDSSIRDVYIVYKFEKNNCPSFMEKLMEKRELIVYKTEKNYGSGTYQTSKVKKYHQDASGNWVIDKSFLSGLFS